VRELGEVAADVFDVVVVREDANLRRRAPGAAAALVAEGLHSRMAAGARCKQVEIVTDELAAVRHCMARANQGDLVVLCADKHAGVLAELETLGHQAQAGAHTGEQIGDPDLDPSVLAVAAARSGAAAEPATS
jgi:cyanophycin synthetase